MPPIPRAHLASSPFAPRISSAARNASGVSRTQVGLSVAAAALGGLALYNRYAAKRVEQHQPARGSFLQIDNVRLHYFDRGSGAPVVLIHGNMVTAEDFELSGLTERLAMNHRVIAFDRPGIGYSERPRGMQWTPLAQAQLLRRAWQQLGMERPIVVGHSFGTLVALSLALEQPEAIGGLVLLSGLYYPTPRPEPMMALPSALPLIGDVLNHTAVPLMTAASLPVLAKALFAPHEVPRDFLQHSGAAMSVRPGQIRAEAEDSVNALKAVKEMQLRYRELPVPLALVAGKKDKAVPPHHSIRLHQELPHSVLRVIPGTGHMVHYTHLDAVAELIDLPPGATKDQLTGPLKPNVENVIHAPLDRI